MDEVEQIQEAIQQLVDRRRRRRNEGRAASELDEEEEDRLLSDLLSQLASLKVPSAAEADKRGADDDLASELRKLRRQNTITHCLLSAMIVVTAAWQLSAASLLLSLKSGLTNPFKTAVSLIGSVLKGGGGGDLQELQRLSSNSNHQQLEGPSSAPQLSLPELPAISLPSLAGDS
ncbi:unnamed protein product [Spirodela intermedia]|uniref:Uncharacterized protein n=1 Tax=Spirodela intermedia TaxID=51605 RepID=A0A7I8KET4_SPIIN|nr:unnamed protein product [Spirodela intermedia]